MLKAAGTITCSVPPVGDMLAPMTGFFFRFGTPGPSALGFVRHIAIAALVMMLGGCGSGEDSPPPVVPDPLTYAVQDDGPFAAGYRTIETTYSSLAGAGERTITVNLWYPTQDTDGEPPRYELFLLDPDVFADASLAPPAYGGTYPVWVHSHGHKGFGGNSSEVWRHLATHGWVVVAPDHKDNTLAGAVDPLPTKHYFERPLDIRAALDALEDLPESDPLAGKVDTGGVVMSGHSFGCYTTWASGGAAYDMNAVRAACEAGEFPAKMCTEAEVAAFETDLSDSRVQAILPMAGRPRDMFFGQDGYDAVPVPILFLTGGDDDVGAAGLFDQVSGIDMTWVEIAGGCHQLFGLGNCEGISDELGFPIVNAYALAFGRRHLLGDEDGVVAAIVDGSHEVSDLVSFKKK